jgi:hypothetical protein
MRATWSRCAGSGIAPEAAPDLDPTHRRTRASTRCHRPRTLKFLDGTNDIRLHTHKRTGRAIAAPSAKAVRHASEMDGCQSSDNRYAPRSPINRLRS